MEMEGPENDDILIAAHTLHTTVSPKKTGIWYFLYNQSIFKGNQAIVASPIRHKKP